MNEIEKKPIFTDEYLEKHWREFISVGLSQYDETYYKSEQYKEDRGTYLMEQDK